MKDFFHPIVEEWFESRFSKPTPAQEDGWPAIAGGRHTLISAPTGSGKTLAAFLICVDRLLRSALEGTLPEAAQVVYVSPLKALSNDVHKNLSLPLVEITDLARSRGYEVQDIRVALRTGDTPAYERQVTARKPPHIWITTPESLYILLTSESGRRGMAGVRTLILDEIHAVAQNKRGSHLALTVERLCALVRHPVTRIGLSATQRPIEKMAAFLVGTSHIDAQGTPVCSIVDVGHQRELDLRIEIPKDELGPIATNALWEETVDRIAEIAETHRTTLVFANTRRLVERIAYQLSRRIGEAAVVAHHGSLSRKTRLHAEKLLKNGDAKICVATASLELGIDIGTVDLVCQIGSPRSIGVLLQRVGRSGHWLGGVSQGRLFPLTRDELLECAALVHAVRRGELDLLTIPAWPLDILSQQIVAMCGAGEWGVDELFRTVRRAFPYEDLPRPSFDSILEILSEGIAGGSGRRSAYLHFDRIQGRLRGRRGARLAALTNGGAIPDNADYDVIADPEGTYVGSVNEDFVVESMAGDVFLLGNTAWRIRRVEKGKVRVEDARGEAPLIPFWLGEAPSRTRELSHALSNIREQVSALLSDRTACVDWLTGEVGLTAAGAEQVWGYCAEGARLLGTVPTAKRIVIERFFDESGGMQIVIHSPLGGRINRAWGLALRKRFCRSFDFELQTAATDDGINLSLGPQHSFPLEDVTSFLGSRNIRESLVQAVLPSPLFTTRWRWTLTRSLALRRFSSGRRVPPFIQRMRADDMLSLVFPAQTQCQDNRDVVDVEIPDHPLVFETLRDCLDEALDLEGLRETLQALERGEIEILAKETPMPSAFSHQILNAMPYAFLDDAPLEERRARAVILRRALPEDPEDLGKLNPDAVRSAAEDAWPEVRDAEELHDLLLGLILFPESEGERLPAEAAHWMESLVQAGRAACIATEECHYWVAAEKGKVAARLPGLQVVNWKGLLPPPGSSETAPESLESDAAMVELVRGWVEVSGPLDAGTLSLSLGLDKSDVYSAFIRLEGEGLVLRGRFTESDGEEEEFCDRRILARIHRATLRKLRREIEPVPAADFLRFLFDWLHVSPGARLEGEAGVLEVVEQLQGFEAAGASWEDEILAARVRDYSPAYLDNLCMTGEVVWGRWTKRESQSQVPARRPGLTRTAPIGLALREDMPWLLQTGNGQDEALSVPAQSVLSFLRGRGASFFAEMRTGIHHLPSEIEEALWQLVAAGLVTADSFSSLRALVSGEARRQEASRRRRRQPRRTREGRWSLLRQVDSDLDNKPELWARQCLRRYGVMLRELLVRESGSPPWRDLIRILRRMEARGEIRGGRFVAGFSGEQFALPEAIEALRTKRPPAGQFLRVSGCDPLNLAGILTPGPKLAAVLGNRVVYRDGVPVALVESGKTQILSEVEEVEKQLLSRLLDPRTVSGLENLIFDE